MPIDTTKCIGCRACEEACPEAFTVPNKYPNVNRHSLLTHP